jgi:hypothetical protein
MNTTLQENHIDRAMVSALASSALSDGFQARSTQPKDNKIGMCYLFAKHATNGWLGIRIKVPSGATCRSADCYSAVNWHHRHPTKHVVLVQSGYNHHLIECNLFSPWHSWHKLFILDETWFVKSHLVESSIILSLFGLWRMIYFSLQIALR